MVFQAQVPSLNVSSVTANLGIPPVLNCFDWALDRACEVGNRHSLPVELRHHLILQRFSHRVTKIFSGNRADPVGYPAEAEWALLTQMLEEDLSSIEAEILPRINSRRCNNVVGSQLTSSSNK